MLSRLDRITLVAALFNTDSERDFHSWADNASTAAELVDACAREAEGGAAKGDPQVAHNNDLLNLGAYIYERSKRVRISYADEHDQRVIDILIRNCDHTARALFGE